MELLLYRECKETLIRLLLIFFLTFRNRGCEGRERFTIPIPVPLQPCIIKFLDAVETPEKMFIVMEAAGGGELFDRLVSRGSLPEPTVKFFFYQLCLAVQYLHQHRITHRDIKVGKLFRYRLMHTVDGHTQLLAYIQVHTHIVT